MTSKIQEAAEKYATRWFDRYNGTLESNAWKEKRDGFLLACYFMLDELSKGGEFKKLWVTAWGDLQPDGFLSGKVTENKCYEATIDYEDGAIQFIDIAALQSANAKIAKLTEALKRIMVEVGTSTLAHKIAREVLKSTEENV